MPSDPNIRVPLPTVHWVLPHQMLSHPVPTIYIYYHIPLILVSHTFSITQAG